jgi:hypothetical protein
MYVIISAGSVISAPAFFDFVEKIIASLSEAPVPHRKLAGSDQMIG